MAFFTLDQWLERHQLSRPTWYRWMREGKVLPKHFTVGRSIRISVEADAEWLAAHQAIAA